MTEEYIHSFEPSEQSADIVDAIIVLPDIFVVTNYTKDTCQQLADKYNKNVYLLDYFYPLTNKTNSLNPNTEMDHAVELMGTLKGDDFTVFFKKSMQEIMRSKPLLKQFSVFGFCFGGRLAYLAGMLPEVNRVISFYGGGANTPAYYQGQTPVEALCKLRKADQGLQIVSFFGTEDESIPVQDRQLITQVFKLNQIQYSSFEYQAKHAFFQPGRPNYNEVASKEAWGVLDQIFIHKR